MRYNLCMKYISHRGQVGILICITLLLLAIIAWFVYELYTVKMLTESTYDTDIDVATEEVAAITAAEVIPALPLVTNLHFVESSAFLDLSEVFSVNGEETDRTHYYTLLANPNLSYEEAQFATVPTLPEVSLQTMDGGEISYDVMLPADATYTLEVEVDLLHLDNIIFNTTSFPNLTNNTFVAENPEATALTFIASDISKIVTAVDAAYKPHVVSPLARILVTDEPSITQASFVYPVESLIVAFAFEAYLTKYIGPEYYQNNIDDYITSNIMHGNFLHSDVIMARMIANQYMEAAGKRLTTWVLEDIDNLN